MLTNNLTMDTKLGKFTFAQSVPLSLAKLLRDSVVGQYFSPQRNGNRIVDENSAQEFVYEHCCRDLSHIQFNLAFAEEYQVPSTSWEQDLIDNDLDWVPRGDPYYV